MLIMIFKDMAFKEFTLPNSENIDYSIIADKNLFGLNEDLEIKLENISKSWFVKSKKYSISVKGLIHEQIKLQDEMIIDILTQNGEILTALIVDCEISFVVFDKYRLPDNVVINVGSDESNIIKYNFTNLVSAHHCNLKIMRNRITVEDHSRNGVYVNHRKIRGTYELKYGDTINIFGLNIVMIGDILCVGTSFGKVKISDMLSCYKLEIKKKNETIKHKVSKVQYFNRAPRVLPNINKGVIKIDPPPSPQFSKKKPLFNIIGPSFTMAIPMMLGTGLSIFSSMYSGAGSSAFMFTGIITSVGSAILGAVWAVLNLRQTRKEEFESENTRYEAYGKYLIDVSNKIKKQYSENEMALHSMYPSADECVKYDRNSPSLWNRNFFHKDFLFCRLGLGDLPFQVNISVPEDKFTLVRDQLKDKPELVYEQFKMLKNVPVGVDLKSNPLIGVVGASHDTYGIVDAIITQISANNSYTDVKIAFCGNCNCLEGHERWNYIKFLPHNWTSNNLIRFYASDRSESSDMLYELTDIIRHRAESVEKTEFVKPHIILIVTDAAMLEDELISKYIFHPTEKLGLTTILIAEHREALPNSCNMIIEKTNNFSGVYNTLSTDGEISNINFDTVNLAQLERMAKRLSNIKINEIESDSSIPSKLDFFEMLDITSLNELNLIDSWCKNRTYNNMRAIIGKKSGGLNCYLDIYEKYHGPHGLVAGTTGSGKSEILQTFILSLATNFSPEDVSFFIIDFKGGGMANLFLELPHLIGSISNLAGDQIRRAMISIKSENSRRQMLFNEYGVNNIDAYTRLYKNGEAKKAIPHLIIIIDEFAEMKREGSEEYINELISVAQIGRSLGVHLILATQKPSGTVSDNIWSNSKFKLCLRVQDRKDSSEMLHKPDAAYITQAGRCYLQVGNDELYELFQSGWSGAIYDPDKNNKASIATMITSIGKTAVIGNYIKHKKKEHDKKIWFDAILKSIEDAASDLFGENVIVLIAENKLSSEMQEKIYKISLKTLKSQGFNFEENDVFEKCFGNFIPLIGEACKNTDDRDEVLEEIIRISEEKNIRMPELKEKTQLEAVVEYIAKTAEENGYKRQSSLWLPVLPAQILLSDIIGENKSFSSVLFSNGGDVFSLEAVFGIYDDPENQEQLPASINLADSGHIAICGSVTSGKSTFLQTFAYSLLTKYDPTKINFYFLDFSSNILLCFQSFPHVGDILTSNSADKADKFFNMLIGIMEERKKKFGGGNYVQYIKSTAEKIPILAVVIDNYANFKDKTENKFENALIRISREGLSYGIYLIISSAGFGISEIPNRIGDNMKTVVALNMGDKYKFAEVFRNSIRPTVLPDSEKKGRGLVAVDGRLLEFQTAVSVAAKDDYERNDIIRQTGIKLSTEWKGKVAEKIPFIPDNARLSDISALSGYKAAIKSDNLLPFAYRLTDASVYSIDLRYNYCFTILGKRQSGKTNILKLLIYAAQKKGGDIVVFEKNANLLKVISEKYNAKYISNDKEMYYWLKDSLINVFVHRNSIKKECIANGMTENEIFDVMQKEKPIFIFIDNLKEFFISAQKPSDGIAEMASTLHNLISKGSLHNIYFFGCLDTEDYGTVSAYKLYNPFVSYKKGILTGASVNSQRIFNFQNIPFNELSKNLKKGIGITVSDEEEAVGIKIAVPLMRREEL